MGGVEVDGDGVAFGGSDLDGGGVGGEGFGGEVVDQGGAGEGAPAFSANIIGVAVGVGGGEFPVGV